ncbi:MAG: GNAT family N-acetyltransferase [Parachlamydiales bacterium]|jgi:3-dehydroquinate dehydratase/shikimate dehydrogenase
MHNNKNTIIESERLVLRQWCEKDLELFAELNADPRVMEFFPATWTREESNTSLQSAHDHIEKYGWGKWAVFLIETGEFIGRIGLEEVDFEASFSPNIELGYRLAYKHWGKGYASEGAKAALGYGFKQFHFNEIVAFTPIHNLRSQIVMKRIGMQHDPKDDFNHPKLPKEHRLSRHVLYRLTLSEYNMQLI